MNKLTERFIPDKKSRMNGLKKVHIAWNNCKKIVRKINCPLEEIELYQLLWWLFLKRKKSDDILCEHFITPNQHFHRKKSGVFHQHLPSWISGYFLEKHYDQPDKNILIINTLLIENSSVLWRFQYFWNLVVFIFEDEAILHWRSDVIFVCDELGTKSTQFFLNTKFETIPTEIVQSSFCQYDFVRIHILSLLKFMNFLRTVLQYFGTILQPLHWRVLSIFSCEKCFGRF